MPTSIVSQGDPGAGRVLDVIWPRPMDSALNGMLRGGIAYNGMMVQGGGAGAAFTRYRGRFCYAMPCTVAAASELRWNHYVPQPMLTKSSANLYGSDDTLCFRIVAILACSNPGSGGNVDCGFQLAAGQTPSYYNANAAAAVSFHFQGTDDVRYKIRTATAGVEAANRAIAGITTADFNAYEWRYLGPSNLAEGQLKAFINGRNVATDLAGAATILPDGERGGPSYGWIPFVVNYINANFQPTIYVAGFRLMIGPTENSLL